MSSMDAYFRDATHHELILDTAFRTQKMEPSDRVSCTCPIPELRELAPYIIKLKDFSSPYFSNSILITLQDVKYYPFDDSEPTHLCLLINATDRDGSITVLNNPKKKTRKEIPLDEIDGEGYETSSHVIISLSGKNRKYKTVISRAPKLPTNILNLFFNKILFQIAKNNSKLFEENTKTNIIDPSTGKAKKIQYKPIAELRGMLDQELFNKMNKSGLSDVTLIRYDTNSIKVPDMHDRIIPIESTMKIKPTESPYAVIDWLKKVGGFFYRNENGNFTQIKVKYNDDLNKARTVTMYSNNIKLDALEKTFIKKSVIEGFSSRLKSSYDNINSEIINKLHGIM